MSDSQFKKTSSDDDDSKSDPEKKENDEDSTSSVELLESVKKGEESIKTDESSSVVGSSIDMSRISFLRRLSEEGSTSRRRRPVFFAYRARQRPKQPFMTQENTLPPNNPVPPPNPPPYYRNQVTPDQHRPEMIRQVSDMRHAGRNESPNGVDFQPQRDSTNPITKQPVGTRDVVATNFPTIQGQPGGAAMISNPLFNFAFWAPYPDSVPASVLPCLAHLYQADSLFIIQQINVIELLLFSYINVPNFYLIQNKNGHVIYYVYETSDLCMNACCTSTRGYQLHVMDIYNNEVIYMNRPCGCSNYPCCYPMMEVYSPPLVPVGAIIQVFNPKKHEFTITDADENEIFKIYGPLCFNCCGCCLEVDFTIHALDRAETEVGIIRRQWGGFVRTILADSDLFGITFPQDLDVKIKAVFLGALFFIALKRTGWVLRNVEDPETVSGHMYRMSVMTFLIPETSGVDKTKCMKLSIVHDLAECIVGDLTPFCGVDANEKHRQEDAAMKELTQMVGDSGVEIYKLYKEYEAQVTKESKFVKDLDRLDMILQAFEYEKMGDRPGKLEEFFTSTLNKFHFPWTIGIVKEIYEQRNLHIKKDKV